MYTLPNFTGFSFTDDLLIQLSITLNSQVTNHTRAVYNFLDFLGDIGGLFDALKVIAWSIITIITQGLVSAHLVKEIFFVKGNNNDQNSGNT